MSVGSELTVLPVRHPSYGGQTEFRRSIREIYGLSQAPPSPGPSPIPGAPKNVARSIRNGPPKKDRDYPEGKSGK